ncbi:MAG: glycosyltransferase family 2 protein [Candidatus Eremiobacteraeota bacterium]|nr:glycosyltransferase family 2 protein [Candidatus Eremiobacteraeota bacterium]
MTVVVLTRDEESRLSRALGSLPHGVSILVLDAQSCDRTREIAALYGARVVERPWNGFVDARRFALAQVATPWAFALDADEALDDDLRDALLGCTGTADGYAILRDTYFCGKPLRMWKGESLLRLMRVANARVEANPASGGAAELHERYVVDGPVQRLSGRLFHYSYETVESYREKFARYTDLEAAGDPPRANPLLVPLRFAHALFARGALLDGSRGIYIAWMSALYPSVVSWKARRAR